ncbi:MAG: phosphohydrolase [Clostridiales bacterium]|nr:phosphohydrolase [Clostridiales bacterium]MCF8022315.1 phosphohydrolase [Clostridiales bacterium]
MQDIYNNVWIETFTGRRFWPLAPRSEDVVVEDIAHALSMLCRYNGQCRFFYSVGQHSLLCSELAQKQRSGIRLALLMLLHDASEAYVSDVTSPIKPFLNNFEEIENRVQKVIWKAFSIKEPDEIEIHKMKEIDLTLLTTEAETLMPFNNWNLPYSSTDKITISERVSSDIKTSFIKEFFKLKKIMQKNKISITA